METRCEAEEGAFRKVNAVMHNSAIVEAETLMNDPSLCVHEDTRTQTLEWHANRREGSST